MHHVRGHLFCPILHCNYGRAQVETAAKPSQAAQGGAFAHAQRFSALGASISVGVETTHARARRSTVEVTLNRVKQRAAEAFVHTIP